MNLDDQINDDAGVGRDARISTDAHTDMDAYVDTDAHVETDAKITDPGVSDRDLVNSKDTQEDSFSDVVEPDVDVVDTGVDDGGLISKVIYYVHSEATGSNDGSNWTNAFNELPPDLERGATYLIADGTYAGYDFDNPETGSDIIIIRKATVDSHGTEVGWDVGFGDGQTVFGPSSFNTDYFVINGVSTDGIKFVVCLG